MTTRLRWVYEAEQSETHASIALVGYQRALRRLYDGWWVPEATMAKGLSAVEEHYRERRGFVGAREAIPLEAVLATGFLNFGHNPPESLRAFETALPQLEKLNHPDLDEVKNLIAELKKNLSE